MNYQLTNFQNQKIPAPFQRRIQPLRLFWLSLTWVSIIGLLFLLFQLWGTGLSNSQFQQRLARDFKLIYVNDSNVSTSTVAPRTTVAPPNSAALEAIRKVVAAEDGAVIARMTAPSIGMDEYVVEGTSVRNLRSGVGRYRGSAFIGDNGNVALAGHRTTYGAPFGRINELVPGDQISFATSVGTATYEVIDPTPSLALWGRAVKSIGNGHAIVQPDDNFVLQDVGDNRLTLTACSPKFSARERIVVVARLLGVRNPMLDPLYGIPAPTIISGDPESPTSTSAPLVARVQEGDGQSLTMGLNGLPNQFAPSVVFGLLALVVLAAISVASNKYGRTIAFSLGLLPFLCSLWLLFTHLELLLPAY
jgi:sortase A